MFIQEQLALSLRGVWGRAPSAAPVGFPSVGLQSLWRCLGVLRMSTRAAAALLRLKAVLPECLRRRIDNRKQTAVGTFEGAKKKSAQKMIKRKRNEILCGPKHPVITQAHRVAVLLTACPPHKQQPCGQGTFFHHEI